MASTVLAYPTCALEGTNRRSGPAMEESENDAGCLEQLLLYADEHYLAGKCVPGRPFRKGPTWGRRISSTRSCRYSGVKGSARKGCLDLRLASTRCLEIVCGTIATPTSARIVERVTVGSTSACRTMLRSSLLVVFLVASDPVFRAWVPSRVHCSQQFLVPHYERSTWPATRRVDQPAVFIPMIRPLSNSLNWEKYLLERLSGMFRLPKSSYNRQVSSTLPRHRKSLHSFGHASCLAQSPLDDCYCCDFKQLNGVCAHLFYDYLASQPSAPKNSNFQSIRKIPSRTTSLGQTISINSREVHRRPRNTTIVTSPSLTVRKVSDAICAYALDTLMTIYPNDMWLHIYTHGSAKDEGSAGAAFIVKAFLKALWQQAWLLQTLMRR
ncbi:uncharacterized protein TNCV_2709361 [Trichonephila clavipes]|nr:uncharacterized protein TNCV_2709361 [Trichonephila clavipes]